MINNYDYVNFSKMILKYSLLFSIELRQVTLHIHIHIQTMIDIDLKRDQKIQKLVRKM